MFLRISFSLCILVLFGWGLVRFFQKQPTSMPTILASPKKSSIQKVENLKTHTEENELTVLAKILGAVPLEDTLKYINLWKEKALKSHFLEFNKAWNHLEDSKLQKLRKWREDELSDLNQNNSNLFYPFSGPDFLNAYLLFPNCPHYLLFGLEKVGEIPSLAQMKGEFLQNYLTGIRTALSEIFQRNYFITSRMSSALNAQVKGILPILLVFLIRTENTPLNLQKFYVDNQGNFQEIGWQDNSKNQGVWGVRVAFQNKNRSQTQFLYYFGTDLADGAMSRKGHLLKFLQQFERKITFIKSASYLLHTQNFLTIRHFILNETQASVQDDTGVPYRFFKEKNWQVQLYGRYARPIRDFNYGYQEDLNQRFLTDKNIKPLNFTFGYHWWTDKSSILVCKKP